MKALAAWLFCATLMAQTALTVDPARTTVEFTVGSTLHTVHGTFAVKRSSVRFDLATGGIEGELAIDATSGASGDESRDKRMHREIIESAKYPEIVFRPDRVEGKLAPQGASQVKVHGMFAIHGSEHELMVPVDVQAADGEVQATAHFDVPYVQWGMKNANSFILRVDKNVSITVHARL